MLIIFGKILVVIIIWIGIYWAIWNQTTAYEEKGLSKKTISIISTILTLLFFIWVINA